jgi:hypothetical protein
MIMITLSDHSPSFIFIAHLTTATAYSVPVTARKTASRNSAKGSKEKNKNGKKIS